MKKKFICMTLILALALSACSCSLIGQKDDLEVRRAKSSRDKDDDDDEDEDDDKDRDIDDDDDDDDRDDRKKRGSKETEETEDIFVVDETEETEETEDIFVTEETEDIFETEATTSATIGDDATLESFKLSDDDWCAMSYQDTAGSGMYLYPDTSALKDSTEIPYLNFTFGELYDKCKSILEAGRPFDKELLRNIMCIGFPYSDYIDTYKNDPDQMIGAIAMYASVTNNFSGLGLEVQECYVDLVNKPTEYVYTMKKSDGTTIDIKVDYSARTCYMGNASYNSEMFSNDTLAVWMVAFDELRNS